MSMSAEGQFRLEGCTVLGANGFPFAAGGTLSVQFDEGAVNFIGPGRSALFSYAELAELNISGPGSVTTGGGFVGGGFGVEGALQGMAIAAVLNLISTRTKIHTFLTFIANFGEIHLHYSGMEPSALRIALAPVFVKLRRLEPSWIANRTNILDNQLAAGAIDREAHGAALRRLTVTSDWKDPVLEVRDLKALKHASDRALLESAPKGTCPNCSDVIPVISESCPKCKAAFGIGSAWQILPL
ncbi:hypothetical protein WH367_19270 [Comamonas sp. MYb21]|uniref:hypothetical protein n=1 Tax=Comamonas sp. MYb21 TaxID=1848648 RepID=UPI0030AF72EE